MTTGDENYKRLRAELDRRLRSDRRLSALAERIAAGTADFADTAEYTQIVARHIGEVMSENIGEITDPVGKELAARALLRDEYESINGVLGEVQAHIDEELGIQLEPVKPAFPAERVAQAAHSLLDPTVTEQTIRRRARSTSENITNSFHDDFIEENARFRSRAGLKVYVERRTSGKCCPWCTEVAGRYLMSEQPEGLFRRHDNCDCVIIYDGKVLRGQRGENGRRTRTWEDTGEREARIEYAESKKPAKLSREEAERLQGEHMPEGLTGGKPNYAKAIDMFEDNEVPSNASITTQGIFADLRTSNIGKEILDYLPNLGERIHLDYSIRKKDLNGLPIYGEEYGGRITVFLLNCENTERASRTVIHECTHLRFGIGQSQWAECVCYAQEFKHKYKRDNLTIAEKRRIIRAVKAGYTEYNWRRGGIIYGRRQNSIR